MQTKRNNTTARELAQREFLAKQRDIALAKGFNQFVRSPKLSPELVTKFFSGCSELVIVQEDDCTVRISRKKTK